MFNVMRTKKLAMQFVDGENFTIRAQQIASNKGGELGLRKSSLFKKDVLFLPHNTAAQLGVPGHFITEFDIIRSFYYTSMPGDTDAIEKAKADLRDFGFAPRVFKRPAKLQRDGSPRGRKMVDIQLATEMLSHAFRANYGVAILIAGDADYVPLVEEVQRLGKVVWVAFFAECTGPDLRLAADSFIDLTQHVDHWIKKD